MCRTMPSSLDNRSFNIESLQSPQNICQTRIVLKDMADDSNPREPKSLLAYGSQPRPQLNSFVNEEDCVPRFSISRKEMSKVYMEEIENINNTIRH